MEHVWISVLMGLVAAGLVAVVIRRDRVLEREFSKSGSLLTISQAVQKMLQSADLHGVIEVVYAQLKKQNLDFHSLMIHCLTDEVNKVFESYEMRATGEVVKTVPVGKRIYDMWKKNDVIYRFDLDHDDGGLGIELREQIASRLGGALNCILDVPHPRGTMVLLSARPNAFSPEHLAFVSQVAGILSVGISRANDLEKRAQAQAQARKLFHAVEQSPVSIMITDTKGAIEYVNPKFEQVTGYNSEEVKGKTPRILKSGETPAEEYKRLWQKITSGSEWRGEFHNRRKNGELFWELALISPVRDERGEITNYIAVKEDITERKRLEEALRQTERERVLVETAGAAAHEINQPLTVILGLIQMLLSNMDKKDDLYEDLVYVHEAGQNIKGIVGKMTGTHTYHTLDYVGDTRIVDFGFNNPE